MIYIDEETKKLVNIKYPYKGYQSLDTPERRLAAGVIEIERDSPPEEYLINPEYYIVSEDWEATMRPYIIYTRRTDDQVLERRWIKIKAFRDELRENGGCQVGDKWYHSDQASKQQWEHMVNNADKLGLTDDALYLINGLQVPWKTMDGSYIVLTAGLIRQVSDALEIREAIIFARGVSLASNLEDITSGWPTRFQS